MAHDGPPVHLPDEILAVIPTDPFEQLDLARKITSMAIASRVSTLEMDAGRLRQKVAEKDRVVSELESRVFELEKMVREADERARVTLEENVKLLRERDTLALTAKNLNRDLTKLEKFKKHLMLSLSEDNSSHPVESVDIVACDQSVPQAASLKDDEPVGYTTSSSITGYMARGNAAQEKVAGSERPKFWPTPYITPQLTPTATPNIISTSVSPQGISAVGSPKMTSGATSPSKSRTEGRIVSTPWYSASQKSSATDSPPHGRTLPGSKPQIDGKEFFRQARNRLSYEQFGAFLANIKELNAHRQPREETLRKAHEIFGTDNKDLYLSFHGLLYRRHGRCSFSIHHFICAVAFFKNKRLYF